MIKPFELFQRLRKSVPPPLDYDLESIQLRLRAFMDSPDGDALVRFIAIEIENLAIQACDPQIAPQVAAVGHLNGRLFALRLLLRKLEALKIDKSPKNK